MDRERAATPASAASDGAAAEPDLRCDAALALVRRFVAGDEDVAARPRVRAHLARCPACRDQYRSEVVLVAQLARGGARGLSSLEGLQERAQRSLLGARRGQRLGLARFVLPAMGLYALYAIAGPGAGGPVRCTSLGSGVTVAGAPLAREEGAREVQQGAVCTTEAEGRARLEWAGTALVLEPRTAIRFERQDPLRLQLFAGRLLVEGSVVITTAAGVVETHDASAIVDLDAERLDVACAQGSARLVDGAGEQALGPGLHAVRALRRAAGR